MKMRLLILIVILFCSRLLYAQRDNVSLLVQSPDGKTVKLVWFFKSWSKDITGFDIKRKEGLQDWVKLNNEPILPEIAPKKKLTMVESDPLEESRVKAKLFKLLANHKLKVIDNNTFLQMLSSDDRAAMGFAGLAQQDYDIALMSGFAYVDHTITRKTNYEYGLFIQGTNILLDSVLWNYGQIPNLDAVKEITARGTTSSNGIQVIWTADQAKIRSGDIAGFNIYREGIRLNGSPIMPANSKDPSEFMWLDKSASGANTNLYSISAESLFGIEGIIKSYTYNPEEHPGQYIKPEVQEISSLGYYFKEGISIKWSFPKESNRFLKGFYVEKDNMPEGYVRVSNLLDSNARIFVDKTASPVTSYIRFRVVAVYNDKTIVPGVEKIYSYFPVAEPPVPQNVKARSVNSGNKLNIYLTWDPPISGDSATDYYRVYIPDTLSYIPKFIAEKEPVLKNKYTYTISHGPAKILKFCVSAIAKNGNESQLSDTVTIQTISLDLPQPAIKNVYLDSNRAVVEWSYTDVPDVKGYRLYQNNEVVEGEERLGKNIHYFKTPVLTPGMTYSYSVRAVSENGVLSNESQAVSVSVPKSRRR